MAGGEDQQELRSGYKLLQQQYATKCAGVEANCYGVGCGCEGVAGAD